MPDNISPEVLKKLQDEAARSAYTEASTNLVNAQPDSEGKITGSAGSGESRVEITSRNIGKERG